MAEIGTPFSLTATKVALLGAGELGKEVVIELKRLGCEVIALDKYENAPAMQVADRSYVLSMLDDDALEKVLIDEQPDYIVPEIEAIATSKLISLEQRGFTVVPSAKAAHLTMNREGIRTLVAEELGIKTSLFAFADDKDEFEDALEQIGFPCVVKPIMSSSGKGQAILNTPDDVDEAWQETQEAGRNGAGRVIIESFVDFDYEITLLTVRHIGGTSFCEPIGHRQEDGDYRESWQPQTMSETALKRARRVAQQVTDALGGHGLFGVELFIKGEEVFFSEVSPRPHDTGMVTLISQDLSEFALHVRAFLGLPIPNISFRGPSASVALVVEGDTNQLKFSNLEKALEENDTDIKIFGKPTVEGKRRMGVMLARDKTEENAVDKAKRAASHIRPEI